MNSRLIYESSKTYIRNVEWVFPENSKENEWRCFEIKNIDQISKIIQNYFGKDKLYFVISRNESFESELNDIFDKIKYLIGETNFYIWNLSFKKVIEFDKIGVYRKGIKI